MKKYAKVRLDALGVPGVLELAGRARSASSRAGVVLTTALSVLLDRSGGTTSGLGGSSTRKDGSSKLYDGGDHGSGLRSN